MYALVTGGQGFVGSHLCARLVAEGHRVRARAPSSDLGNSPASTSRSRRRNRARESAGGRRRLRRSSPRRALERTAEQDLFRVNADGTRNLVAAAAGAHLASRFVYKNQARCRRPSPGGSTSDRAMPPGPDVRTQAGGRARGLRGRARLTIIRPDRLRFRERDVLGISHRAPRLPAGGFLRPLLL
jgi:nucleoside-diphosphate-sugar epimerase